MTNTRKLRLSLAAAAAGLTLLGACAAPQNQAPAQPVVERQSWPTADETLPREDRRQIQQLLAALGYPAGGADGVVGSATRNAIRAYQADKGVNPNGVVSSILLATLRSDAERLGVATAEARPERPAKPARTPTRTPARTTPEPVAAKPVPAADKPAATATETPKEEEPVLIRRQELAPKADGGGWN